MSEFVKYNEYFCLEEYHIYFFDDLSLTGSHMNEFSKGHLSVAACCSVWQCVAACGSVSQRFAA